MKLGANRSQYFLIFALFILPALIGCNKILSSDSGRAQEFLETLINEPENNQKLIEITLNQQWSSKKILPLIHAQNTLQYLRARLKQDQDLEYTASRKTSLSDNRSYVEVAITESSSGLLRKKKFRYVFKVLFEVDKDGNNIISGCENVN